MKSLGKFILNKLRKYRKGVILDGALGIGCESIFLVKNGFNVISNEVNSALRNKAIKAGLENGVRLTTSSVNWLDIGKEFPKD